MLTVEEARQRMLDTITTLPIEKRGILDSLSTILAEDVYASENIPPFHNSAMDGFAVVAEDVSNASEAQPVQLSIIETIQAGYAPTAQVQRGSAARIMTGAMMPEGADAVVMKEVTQLEGEQVAILEGVEKDENVRFMGESVEQGDLVMSKSKLIRPQEIAMFASLNRSEVEVYKRPKVAVVSTGDELTPLGQSLEAGKIRDSIATVYAPRSRRLAAIPLIWELRVTMKQRQNVSSVKHWTGRMPSSQAGASPLENSSC